MQKTLAALSLSVGLGLAFCPSAGAMPVSATGISEAATAASSLQQAQYAERRTRNGVVKCYRDFVIGPYRCHRFYSPF
jgi:hypothetical protein